MKTNDLINKIDALLKEFEENHGIIVDDITLNVQSIKQGGLKEHVINHGIMLKVRSY